MPPERSRATDFDYDDQRHNNRRRPASPRRSRTPPSPRRRTRSPDPYSHRHAPDTRGSPDYDRGNDRSRMRMTPERALDDRVDRCRTRRNEGGSGYERQDDHNRGGGDQSYGRGGQRTGYAQGGRDDFFESRRLEREHAEVSFWPRSPTHPYKQDSKDDSKEKGKKHKSSKSESKSKSKSKSKSESRHHKRSKYSDSESEDESESEDDERRHSRSKRKHRSHHHSSRHERDSSRKRRHQSSTPSIDEDEAEANREEEEIVWEEKSVMRAPAPRKESIKGPSLPPPPVLAVVEAPEDDSDSDPTEVGPMPYNPVTGKAMDPKEFGRALRPGEGSAMAAFIEAGERIPRRGEIGLKGPQIEKFEQAGYVMSGSRHRRMNAVRIRKENQVISAEEKRGILKMQAEEKSKREGQIISSFRELVDTKLQETS